MCARASQFDLDSESHMRPQRVAAGRACTPRATVCLRTVLRLLCALSFCCASLEQSIGGKKNTKSCTCDSSCGYDNDGECDDGGLGSDGSDCALGTDCNDCGPSNRTLSVGVPGDTCSSQTAVKPQQGGATSGCWDLVSYVDDKGKTARTLCRSWQARGWCEKSAAFMADKCNKTCAVCSGAHARTTRTHAKATRRPLATAMAAVS